MAQAVTTKGQRLSPGEIDPAAYKAVLGMESYVRRSGLEPGLYELIKIRASQINGCAFCLDMHYRDAREQGESQLRLDVLRAWHEVDGLFSEREQAALALTEAVTLISQGGVSDALWDRVRASFSEEEIVKLLTAISTINVWNRLAISTRMQPTGAA
ncbi:carboxymuconolactone decarboxylase family protein [Frankia sp. CNm7]|uniref:Carboxymuconolactone decarboxylase family protein n=1 Tax=Frankia nepalensis TaxID=1836974 RepID=A0A937RD15_9ACTN|nr:carboxymuconolactone decarboxylase family protein [Frankia nepalensis]MBL7496293.1 carboxymuconolactone decarboxylase family protein [Frankia nepalensis]MBL7508510.1 carboxymuconolactone decarboxylase family protein [Frankia nepalensis]MBL7520243.1 carboxymuconolactone decarboxylase family protein [Frankia nepalensis]MBL7627642.1 carboxymuconolactone decarboxylase family protein [Frankia nepalensis]